MCKDGWNEETENILTRGDPTCLIVETNQSGSNTEWWEVSRDHSSMRLGVCAKIEQKTRVKINGTQP